MRISRESGDWKGRVGVAERLGSDTFLHVHVEGAGLQTVRTYGEREVDHGDEVFLSPDPARIYRFDGTGRALT